MSLPLSFLKSAHNEWFGGFSVGAEVANEGSGHRKHPSYVIIYRQMKHIPLTSTTRIFGAKPEHRATVERYLLAAG